MARNPEPPVIPSDQEADVLFRVQMKLADLMLGYWKHGLAVVGVLLLVTLVVGLLQNYFRDARREVSEKIATIDAKVPQPEMLAMYGMGLPDDLSDTERVDALKKSARDYESVAKKTSGIAATEAWIKAGDIWNRLGEKDSEIKAFQAAFDETTKGIIGYTAGNRLAVLYANNGDKAKAREVLRTLATKQEGLPAENALIDLMTLAQAENDTATVRQVAAEYKARFPKSPRMEKVTLLEGKAGGQPSAPATPEKGT